MEKQQGPSNDGFSDGAGCTVPLARPQSPAPHRSVVQRAVVVQHPADDDEAAR
ncbi:hypothetical protein [Alcaligenes sp. SJTW-7]|uniref:hypothetical protein n=1 Tax=Alcaligenes sp. SJTW-7 TaxID=3078429 RepID=UPI0039E77E70